MKITKLIIGTVFALAASAANAATTTWTPADGDVNFLFSATGIGDENLYAIFDVADFDGLKTAALILEEPADTIDFVANGANFDLSGTATPVNTTTLFGSNHFVIATSGDNGVTWTDATSLIKEVGVNTNIYNIEFATGTIMSIDAIPHVVPVPAAVWLFGSGLIGLVGVSRRRA